MKLIAIFAAAAALAGPAAARDAGVSDHPIILGMAEAPTISFTVRGHPLLQIGQGGCIRGPFVFSDSDGTDLLKLDAGVDYPSGCSSPK